MGRDEEDGAPLNQVSDIFGVSFRWPHLSSITFENLWCSEASLIDFLQIQPNLRSLYLYQVRLTEGIWADVFDGLHKSLNLKSFSADSWLETVDGDYLWEIGFDDPKFEAAAEAYVLHGGSNPLRNEKSDSSRDISDQVQA